MESLDLDMVLLHFLYVESLVRHVFHLRPSSRLLGGVPIRYGAVYFTFLM
jgi:hypothetical protein